MASTKHNQNQIERFMGHIISQKSVYRKVQEERFLHCAQQVSTTEHTATIRTDCS